MIIIVSLLLALCVCVDYASDTITANNTTLDVPDNTVVVNESTEFNNEVISMDHKGKVHTDKSVPTKKKHKKKKKQLPTVSMTGRPSCSRCARNHMPYKWSTHTYLDYCPNCHHYNCLVNKHKSGSVHERELTCKYCDSDYCVVCGKEKYSWSRVTLRSC